MPSTTPDAGDDQRTGPATERTSLAEERTGLATGRTTLAEERTGLATERTTLAEERTGLATERTSMAEERTRLAWWRTGLTAFAVAIGVGRLLPELTPESSTWPYVVLGVAFALYGIALFAYGTRWARRAERQLGLGTPGSKSDRFVAALALAGIGLGLGTILVILFQ